MKYAKLLSKQRQVIKLRSLNTIEPNVPTILYAADDTFSSLFLFNLMIGQVYE